MTFEYAEALGAYLTECGGTLTVSVERLNPARPGTQVTAEWVYATDGEPLRVRAVEGSVFGAVVGLARKLGLEPADEHWVPPVTEQPEHSAFLMVARRQADSLERIAAALENGLEYLDVIENNGLLGTRGDTVAERRIIRDANRAGEA